MSKSSMDLHKMLTIDDDIMEEMYLGSMRRLEMKLIENLDVSHRNKEAVMITQTDEFVIYNKNCLVSNNILGNMKEVDDSNSNELAKNFEIEMNKQSDKTCCHVNTICLII
jgi:hypothetical protein